MPNTQQSKTRGIPALHWTTVHSAFGNRDRSGKKSFGATPRSGAAAPRQATACCVKTLPAGLFDPTLKSDELEADERRRILQQRRRLREHKQRGMTIQPAGSSASHLASQYQTSGSVDARSGRSQHGRKPQRHRKREASFVGLLLAGPTLRETLAHEARITGASNAPRCSSADPRPVGSVSNEFEQL